MTLTKANWPMTTANIYSVESIDANRNDFGHYNVVYSYRVNDEMYTGEFSDYGSENESYLKRDDSIQIRYDPSNPKKSFYPEVRSATKRRLFYFGLGLAIALIVMLIVFLNGGFRR
jgi:Protein of unknown function (DUF3592)